MTRLSLGLALLTLLLGALACWGLLRRAARRRDPLRGLPPVPAHMQRWPDDRERPE